MLERRANGVFVKEKLTKMVVVTLNEDFDSDFVQLRVKLLVANFVFVKVLPSCFKQIGLLSFNVKRHWRKRI